MKKLLSCIMFLSFATIAQDDKPYMHVLLKFNDKHQAEAYFNPYNDEYQEGEIGRYTYRLFNRSVDRKIRVGLVDAEGMEMPFIFPVQFIEPTTSSWRIPLNQHVKDLIIQKTYKSVSDLPLNSLNNIPIKLACIAYCYLGELHDCQRPRIYNGTLLPGPQYAAVVYAH